MLFRSLVVALLVAGAALAPDAGAQDGGSVLTDDAGRRVVFAGPPRRIVSLVPVATEILFALGEGDRIVGRSRWDDYPEAVLAIPSVGDAIRPSLETVVRRRPDLVILIGGADNAAAAADMERAGIPFVVLLFNTLEDLQRNVRRLGSLVDRERAARELWERIEFELEDVRGRVAGLARPRVYYDIGYPPPFTAGAGSYLDSLIDIAGGENVFSDVPAPSPRVSLEAIVARDPDVLVVPVGESGAAAVPSTRPGWEALRAVREGSIVMVPADLVHRLGPRVGRAARVLSEALHPVAAAEPGPKGGR